MHTKLCAALFVIQASSEQLRATAGKHNTLTDRMASMQDPDLLVPMPNDTISQVYWNRANRLIDEAGRRTPPPPTANDAPPTRAPSVWERVQRDPQPYDTVLGAAVLGSLMEPETTNTPPPTQEYVSQQFVAQCPMIMFGNEMYIKAPHCGDPLGNWADPSSGRSILRWNPHDGSIFVGVDSVITGNGSAKFAQVAEMPSSEGDVFQLTNCLDVTRYTIEEKLTRVSRMGRTRTTMRMHDTAQGGPAFFLRYEIRHPNGSIVAHTGFDRMNQNVVNITMLNNEVSEGALVATARREGAWRGAGWRECTENPREWRVEFAVGQRDSSMVATVMDLRVATAALVTLMALRDEDRSQTDGFAQTTSQTQLFWDSIGMWIVSALLLVIFVCFCGIFQARYGAQARRFCFRLESALLPKKSPNPRRAPFNATY